MAQEDPDVGYEPEPESAAHAVERDDCKVQMREWILLGYTKRAINEMAQERCPWASKRAIRTWQIEVRKSLAITDKSAKKDESVNRGIMKQRLEYLFHTCLCPPPNPSDKHRFDPDRKTALECLKLIMQLEGLTKTSPKKIQTNNNLILPGAPTNPRLEGVSTEELRRRIEGQGLERVTLQDSDEVIDVEFEDQ